MGRYLKGPLGKLLLLLLGVGSLAYAAHRALSYQPFEAAPRLDPTSPSTPTTTLGHRRAAAVQILPQKQGAAWRHSIAQGVETPPLSETSTILLAGVDTRPWLFGGRTDALVALVMDNKSDHVGLVSIPRDLLVAIEGHPPNRINTVYAAGLREGGTARGVALLREVVQHAVGLAVDHVLFVDHAGFEGLVDTLGGVGVSVICPILDRFIDPRGPGGRLELRLEAGLNHLDGKTTLMFVRSRHGRGIHDRARRQQAVLLALRDRILELGIPRTLDLLPALRRTVYTDMDTGQLIRLVRRLARIKRSHIHGLLLGAKQAEPRVMETGRWVMVPKPDAIVASLKGLFSARTPGFRGKRTCPPMDIGLQPKPERKQVTNKDKLLKQKKKIKQTRPTRTSRVAPDPGQNPRLKL